MRSRKSKSLKAFKVILLGDCQTGKTSIIQRFVGDTFDPKEQPTIGIDFFTKTMALNGHHYKLQLWDTAGQEKYMSLIPAYLRDPDCVLFVFDLSRAESLASVQKWVMLFRENQDRQSLCLLCGNKSDLIKEAGAEKIEKVASKYKLDYYALSAKTGENVNEIFSEIVTVLVQKNRKEDKIIFPERLHPENIAELESLPTEVKLDYEGKKSAKQENKRAKQNQSGGTCKC